MLSNRVPAVSRLLEISPHQLELVLAEEGKGRLTLLLPPIEELGEIRDLSLKNISLHEGVVAVQARLAENFSKELQALLGKRDRFANSPTYLAHLADLAELAGNLDREYEFLSEAKKGSDSTYFSHRIGANLIARGQMSSAEGMFRGLDLDTDAGANLRLAYLYVCRQKWLEATEFVNKAISIDPLDFGSRMFQGVLALAKGDGRRAIHAFRTAAEEREASSLYANLGIAYILTKKPDKAFVALRKAIALEPFNQNAVAVYADLAFAEKKSAASIGVLEQFVEFEQRNASMWARLARALMEVGQQQKALDALKRQASVEETSAVFNNIGVVYARQGDKRKASEYFSFAMRKAQSEKEHSYVLAARNLLSVYVELGKFSDAVSLGKAVLKGDDAFAAARDRVLSDIYVLFVYSIARLGNEKEAIRFAQRLLEEVPDAHPRLRVWMAGGMLGALSLKKNRREEALAIAKEFIKDTEKLEVDDPRRAAFKNNMAFLYLEVGQYMEASELLSQISKAIHKDPYPTATLGLLQLRKGRLERGEALYKEALRLCRSAYDKRRITQKMHLELGKMLLDKDRSKARRHLTRAINEFSEVNELTTEANELLSTLSEGLK